MSCPYLIELGNARACRALLDGQPKTRKLAMWVCKHDWERYCPLFAEMQKGDKNVSPDAESDREIDEAPWPIRHVNRVGGPRHFMEESV